MYDSSGVKGEVRSLRCWVLVAMERQQRAEGKHKRATDVGLLDDADGKIREDAVSKCRCLASTQHTHTAAYNSSSSSSGMKLHRSSESVKGVEWQPSSAVDNKAGGHHITQSILHQLFIDHRRRVSTSASV